MRVLIAPDKFKGTLTARAAAEAIGRGWRAERPEDDVQLLPMTDGGDGFGEILSDLMRAQARTVATVDPAHRPLESSWWWDSSTRTAVIESARIIGLALLPPGRFHPFELDTLGLGAVLREAAQHGATRCLVGIGGSATNDGGFGLARGLGWQFFDAHSHPLERWTQLRGLSVVKPPQQPLSFDELLVAVDVRNSLLGDTGCTRVYGPQKGLRPADFDLAERSLGRLAEVMATHWKLSFENEPGAGAAGGLGFGMVCFAGARLVSGFEVFARHAHLEERLRWAQLVITGEGALDEQTLMGKGVGELGQRCQRQAVPCVALAGMISRPDKLNSLFAGSYALTPEFVSREEALNQAAARLAQLAQHVAGEWSCRRLAAPDAGATQS